MLLTGCLMLFMAACNFRNTVATIWAKRKVPDLLCPKPYTRMCPTVP